MIVNKDFEEKSNKNGDIKSKFGHIKSFALRQGRVTKGQLVSISTYWDSFGLNYASSKVDLHAIFGNKNEIVLDIGFGDGSSLVEAAKSNPDINFLGVEVNKSCIGLALSKLHQANLSNIKIINYDVVLVLQNMISNQAIAGVQIFFADPWHKSRHKKRRLLKLSFLELLHSKLAEKSFIHFATDWEDYKDDVVEVFNMNQAFTLECFFKNAELKPRGRAVTKFERRGVLLGHDIWDLIYRLN